MADRTTAIRKRQRPAHNCIECRRRKVRCDRAQPCSQCVAQSAQCIYRKDRRETHACSEPSPQSPLEPHSTECPSVSFKRDEICVNKTRVFGRGHWMHSAFVATDTARLGPAGEHLQVLLRHLHGLHDGTLGKRMAKCKDLAREIKQSRPRRICSVTDVQQSLPAPPIMEELLKLYFTTFETCFRIIYRPAFDVEYVKYCQRPPETNSAMTVMLLLIVAIAAALHHDDNVRKDLRPKAESYVWIAQTWLSAPLEKDRLTIQGVQIGCLLVLARQVCQVGADLAWISLGSLTRMAMHMGLHVDPDAFRDMTRKQKELRRRLWYTILEMTFQAAMDAGMTPMIRVEDYNTRMPSAVNDLELEDEQTHSSSSADPMTVQSAIQEALTSSLPLRLNILRVLNNLQEAPSYEEVVALSNQLTETIRVVTPTIANSDSSDASLSFAQSFCSHLLTRLLIALHFTYAIEGLENPLYAHSSQVCGDIFMDMMLFLDDPLYSRLLVGGGGMFRDLITPGSFVIWMQMIYICIGTDMTSLAKRRRTQQIDALLETADHLTAHAMERMHQGETNVKGYIFTALAKTQIRALRDGTSVDIALTCAVQDGFAKCVEIFQVLLSQRSDETSASLLSGLGARRISNTASTNSIPGLGIFNDDAFNVDFLDDDFFLGWQNQAWA